MFMDYLERMQDEENAQKEMEAHVKQKIYGDIYKELLLLVDSEDITQAQSDKIAVRLALLLFKPA